MLVICEQYKTCDERIKSTDGCGCPHSKSHKHESACDLICLNQKIKNQLTTCTSHVLRKDKLKEIEKMSKNEYTKKI